LLLLDNSAWARLLAGGVPGERAAEIAGQMAAGELAVCLPFLLEAGYSARSARDRRALMERLEQLPAVALDAEVEALALAAQRRLTEVGHHRLPPSDLLIAACAHRAEAGVLHYDGDYDVIARHTELDFRSVWLGPPGSI
jgi:predicted nucleic acid-binding protein